MILTYFILVLSFWIVGLVLWKTIYVQQKGD